MELRGLDRIYQPGGRTVVADPWGLPARIDAHSSAAFDVDRYFVEKRAEEHHIPLQGLPRWVKPGKRIHAPGSLPLLD